MNEDDIGEAATLPSSGESDRTPVPSVPEAYESAGSDDHLRWSEGLFQGSGRPRQLGRYVVLGTLGKGGVGVVLDAFDRTLDRRVAVKVLHKELDAGHTARLLREAQAMARLSHPNVVQVFEVGEVRGQTFVAMELVRGKTLREWMRREPRPSWRECVEVFVQVGEGLAAAHAAGLVHRDFKPGNAIVDEEGRPRVLDFGLARHIDTEHLDDTEEGPSAGEEVAPQADDAPLDLPLTRTGTVLGTPAYMPPEQMKGAEADARSDQFSFCVALYEAAYGERPFEGDSMMALLVSMTGERLRPPPKGTQVPTKLRAVLRRGLAFDSEKRWSSMDELLAELRRLVNPRGRRFIALGLAVGLAGLGAIVAVPQYVALQDRCTGAQAQLDGVWDDVRRQQVEDAVLGTGLSYAPDTWERIGPRLDDYAQTWVASHTEVCEATSVRGEQTTEVMNLRMGCLHDHQVALGAAVMVLADADAAVVDKAVTLVGALPSMDRCDDAARLQQMRQRVPPPEDPEVEAEVGDLRERLAEVEAELGAGRPTDALDRVEPVVRRAEVLGYGPLLAEALLQRGRARRDSDEIAQAEQDLERSFSLAADHGHDAVAARALETLTVVVGVDLEHHERALGLGSAALALARGPELEVTVEARVLVDIGQVRQEQGKLAEALHHYRDALAIFEPALGSDHPSVASALSHIGKVMQEQGELAEALTHLQRAAAISERALGEDHPAVATTLLNLGIVLEKQGKLPEAMVRFQRALDIFDRALGEGSLSSADALSDLGNILLEQGELVEALAHYQRALAIYERSLGPGHSRVAKTVGNIATVLENQGKLAEALTHYQRASTLYAEVLGDEHLEVARTAVNMGMVLRKQGRLAEALTLFRRASTIFEGEFGEDHPSVAWTMDSIGTVLLKQDELAEALTHYQRALAIKERTLGTEHPTVATTASNIGLALVRQGRSSEALPYYRRALTIKEKALGEEHPGLAYALLGLAGIENRQRDFDAARAHAERAVSIRERGDVSPDLLASACFVLAGILWNDRSERTRAVELAERARDGYRRHGAGREDDLAEVEAWLVEHRVR